MIEIIPEVFKYIRLMENLPVVATQYERQREDGSIETTTVLNCTINRSVLVDVSEKYYCKVKSGYIEILASDIECQRIEKIIRRCVNEDNPQFNEIRNSLVVLYNGLIDKVHNFQASIMGIVGTGKRLGSYSTLAEYYRDIRKCYHIANDNCRGITLSIKDGEIENVTLTDIRNRNNQVPMLTFSEDCISNDIRLQTLWIDSAHKFEDIKRMSALTYRPDDDFRYNFEELRLNIVAYLQARMENETIGSETRSPLRRTFYQSLDCIYRYVINNPHIEIDNKSKTTVLEFIDLFFNIRISEEENRRFRFVDLVTMSNYVGQTADFKKIDFVISHYKSIRKKLGEL